MIRSNFGDVVVDGSKSAVLADLSCIIKTLNDSGKMTKEERTEAVDRGLKTEDELIDKLKEMIQDSDKSILADILSDLANDLRGGKKYE